MLDKISSQKNQWLSKWNYQLPPREKLLQHGADTLSDAELLAIFLRTGIPGKNVLIFSQELIAEFGSLHNLINADYEQFMSKPGLGIAKYTQLQAVIELSTRYFKTRLSQENILTTPQATYQFLYHCLSSYEREIFMVLFLNNKNNVIHYQEMFSGTINNVAVHPREILKEALKNNAAAIILAHNHPSGKAEPSQADRDITGIIADVCETVDIKLLDHIVIGRGEYVSFAEQGWL